MKIPLIRNGEFQGFTTTSSPPPVAILVAGTGAPRVVEYCLRTYTHIRAGGGEIRFYYFYATDESAQKAVRELIEEDRIEPYGTSRYPGHVDEEAG